jgi:hypothetical protein
MVQVSGEDLYQSSTNPGGTLFHACIPLALTYASGLFDVSCHNIENGGEYFGRTWFWQEIVSIDLDNSRRHPFESDDQYFAQSPGQFAKERDCRNFRVGGKVGVYIRQGQQV